MIGGKLYYTGDKKRGIREVLMDYQKIMDVLCECHISTSGNHIGINRMMNAIGTTYYWKKMYSDVVTFVSI